MDINKKDIIATVAIAEIDAVLILIILRNLGIDTPLIISEKTGIDPSLLLSLFFAFFLLTILPTLAICGICVASFLGKKILSIFQFAKYFLAGTLNTFIDLGVLSLLMAIFGVSAGLHYSIFKAISFTFAVVNSYFWNKLWTFEKKETKVSSKEFSQFYLVTGVGFLMNVGIASLVVNVVNPQFGMSKELWAMTGGIVAAVSVCAWNFLGYKLIVFKK